MTIKHVSDTDIMRLAHNGEVVHRAGIVAFYVESYSPAAAETHLHQALAAADRVTAAAADIRRALAKPDLARTVPQPVLINET